MRAGAVVVGVEERLRDALTRDELGTRVALSRLLVRTFGRDAPVCIGRYVLRRRLGAGGMGEVWVADDPELGREVAIKLLHSDFPHARVVEGRALARLRHPGTVEVFEIGEHEGRAYIVMQYVVGCTLAEWLDTDPPWRAIVATIARVGRALADSHAAGLVHRDIKPTNVMIDERGAVKLVDFGIALLDDATIGGSDSRARNDAATDPITGTLPFMAPEQLAGRAATTKSDQFALCVIAWRALTRAPLFDGITLDERIASIEVGPLDALPRTCPRALDRVLRRGLAADPDARWPDVASLVRALESATRSRMRKAVPFIAFAAMAAVVLAFSRPPTCAEKAETRTKATIGRDASPALRGWGEHWVHGYRHACEDPSAVAFDATMRCLDDALLQVEALRELGDADRLSIDAMDAAIARLPGADECWSPQELAWDDSTLEARKRLAEVYALILADLHAEAEASIVELRPQLEALADRSLIAKLELYAAFPRLTDQDYRGAVNRLVLALREAEASGDEIMAVRAAGLLMSAHERLGDSATSDRYRRHAEATMRRVGSSDPMKRAFAGELAIVLMFRGEFDAAIDQQRLVVEGPLDPTNEIEQELNLAGLLSRAGRHAEAIEHARGALRRHRELGRAQAVSAVTVATNVGVVEALGGESLAAERTFLEGYRLARELLGDDHPYTSTLLFNLGTTALELGDPGRAIPQLRVALAQRRARFEPGDYLRRQMLETLVDAQLEAGTLDDAVESQRELVAEIEASPGLNGATIVPALVRLAELEGKRGGDVHPVLRRIQPWLDGAELPDELRARIAALRSS